MSTVAVVIALTIGSAHAASLLTGANIKDGTLTGKDIKDGRIKVEDLAASSITASKIKNGEVQVVDLAVDAADYLTSLDSTSCQRDGETGIIHASWDTDGWSRMFCDIPLDADSFEPNNQLVDATPITAADPAGEIDVHDYPATLHESGDVDYYRITAECPYTPGGSGSDQLGINIGGSFIRIDVWKGGAVDVGNNTVSGELVAENRQNGYITPVGMCADNDDNDVTFWVRAFSPQGVRSSYTLQTDRS